MCIRDSRLNDETVVAQRLNSSHWEGVCQDLIGEHISQTGSLYGKDILAKWEEEKDKFWQVCPKEMLSRLTHPLRDEVEAA